MVFDAMSQRTFGVEHPEAVRETEVLVSADSHVMEPAGLWQQEVPPSYRDRAPSFGGPRPDDIKIPAAVDRDRRLEEMAEGGVSAEVLFPTWGFKLLSLDDPELEAVCVQVYNDWLIDYCRVSPERLLGLALLSVYDIDGAVKELERCLGAGLRGAVIWQAPPEGLSFRSDHYDPLWATASDAGVPVNLHINSGHGYTKYPEKMEGSHQTAMKLHQAVNSLYDLIFSGVFERFPDLRLVLAENEIGWVPWILEQWDFTLAKGRTGRRVGPSSSRFYNPEQDLRLAPSEYYRRQVRSTFFNDAVGGHILEWWGADNCMWASDFPHGDSTWPHAPELVARDLAHLPETTRAKVVGENVAELYHFTPPAPLRRPAGARPAVAGA